MWGFNALPPASSRFLPLPVLRGRAGVGASSLRILDCGLRIEEMQPPPQPSPGVPGEGKERTGEKLRGELSSRHVKLVPRVRRAWRGGLREGRRRRGGGRGRDQRQRAVEVRAD